jgi:hypothetical protein
MQLEKGVAQTYLRRLLLLPKQWLSVLKQMLIHVFAACVYGVAKGYTIALKRPLE